MAIVLRKLIYKGSTNVTSLEHEIEWESIKFKRFKVQHRKSVMGAPPFGESFSLSNNICYWRYNFRFKFGTCLNPYKSRFHSYQYE